MFTDRARRDTGPEALGRGVGVRDGIADRVADGPLGPDVTRRTPT